MKFLKDFAAQSERDRERQRLGELYYTDIRRWMKETNFKPRPYRHCEPDVEPRGFNEEIMDHGRLAGGMEDWEHGE